MARACQILGDDHRLDRFEKLVSKLYWSDFNASKITEREFSPVGIEHWPAPERVEFSHVAGLHASAWTAVKPGDCVIKPSWSTHWFKLTANIPAHWSKVPVVLVWCETQFESKSACGGHNFVHAGMQIVKDSSILQVESRCRVLQGVMGAIAVLRSS